MPKEAARDAQCPHAVNVQLPRVIAERIIHPSSSNGWAEFNLLLAQLLSFETCITLGNLSCTILFVEIIKQFDHFYRLMEVPACQLLPSMYRKCALEVWLPGTEEYTEVSIPLS